MGLFRRKPEPESQSQRHQEPVQPDGARPEPAPSSDAPPLGIGHAVFRLELGMNAAAVVELLGDEYLRFGGCWLYSRSPAGHDIELVFQFDSLTSVKVKRKSADGSPSTVLMTMDRDRVEAAQPYQAFADRELKRRAGRSVEKVVIVHGGADLSPGRVRVLVNYVETIFAIYTTGAVIRDLVYPGASPETLTLRFGMMVLVMLAGEGKITNDPAYPAQVCQVGLNGEPYVIIVSYKPVT